MRDGRIEQVDTPHHVYQVPSNLFVAGFIGTPQMNFLPATLSMARDDGHAEFLVEGGQCLRLRVSPRIAELQPGVAVTVGVRPRNLELSSEPAEDAIATTVDIIEPMGAETLAHLNDGIHDLRLVADWRTLLSEGDSVHARFPSGAAHIFAANGQALGS